MTICVPFDGSTLSETALARAARLGEALGEDVLAVTVLPRNDVQFARERDWLGPDEEFELPTVVGRVRDQVASVAPEADFDSEVVDRYASTGTFANRLRQAARAADASLVVVGSENAGHMVASLDSVGSTVAADGAFDVLIVRQSEPE